MSTIGNLIDELTICNLRIWMAEDIKRDQKATDKEIANATRVTNVCNQKRSDLIEEIDIKMNEIAEGKKQKLYGTGSTKMYGKK